MSEPVFFRKEFRTHVVDGVVVSVSRYSVAGELSISADDKDLQAAVSFTETVIRRALDITPPSVVIDVGLLAENMWSVVEANPVFGAGIYAGNVDRILDALLVACRPTSKQAEYLDRFKFPIVME